MKKYKYGEKRKRLAKRIGERLRKKAEIKGKGNMGKV